MHRTVAGRSTWHPFLYTQPEQSDTAGSGSDSRCWIERSGLIARRANAHAAAAAISLAAFVWLLSSVENGSSLAFDQHLRAEVHQFAVSPLTAAMKLVTVFGSTTWILFCAAFS